MENRKLDAKGKGEYTYDFKNDILLFKIKDRDYKKSIDFGNIVVDIDSEDYITGCRLMDASKVFRMEKTQLMSVSGFEFNASSEDKIITLDLHFTTLFRNKQIVEKGQNFVREAIDSHIIDSFVTSTVA